MRNLPLIGTLLIILLFCGKTLIVYEPEHGFNQNLFAQEINKVSDWGYKLQGYTPDLLSINDSQFDLIVMDYSLSGGPEDEFTAEDINRLKFDGACKRKIILSYMSIGEAEEFRFYFNDMPKELLFDTPNPQFPDNIKVRFWDERWQSIIFGNAEEGPDKSYLDRIIDAGFDGIYLDLVSAFEFFGPKEIDGNGERETAAKDMIDFIINMTDYARNIRGKTNFLVVPQNGPGIIDPLSYSFADNPELEAEKQKQRYFSAIDAIGAEDTFFFGNRENNNRLNPEEETIALLNIFRDSGKKVLAVDYVQDKEKIDIFYELAETEGYVPYATVRDLNILIINNGHEPGCNDALGGEETPITTPTPTVTLTPLSSPTPMGTPITTLTPIVTLTPSPTPIATPDDDDDDDDDDDNNKLFTFVCQKDFTARFSGIEVLPISVGDVIGCKLTLSQDITNRSLMGVPISVKLRTGSKTSIKVDHVQDMTDKKGEIEFEITALKPGLDWVAWAVPDENDNIGFSKKDYNSGNAWGMFVEVQENIND